MYLEYWGFEERPFENVPDPRFMYYSPDHREAFMRMRYVAEGRKGAGMITGDVGCGKTTVSRALVQSLPTDRYELGVLAYPALSPQDFLREIIYQMGISSNASSKVDLLHTLNDLIMKNLEDKKESVLIIDEAHIIRDRQTLEEIRLLLNFQMNDRFLLSLILIGQPELKETIRSIPPLDQRISLRCHLYPLNEEETKNYILYRLKRAGAKRAIFTYSAIKEIYHYGDGVPRKVNNICDLSLLVGYAKRKTSINGALVREVVESEG